MVVTLLMSALCGAACSRHASTAAGNEIFRGQTIHVIVGYAAGGGYDMQARMLAEFLGRHLPGSPAVVVENQTGAGGLLAATYLHQQAAADGLTIGLLGASAVIAQVLEHSGVQYDMRRLPVVGAVATERDYVCVSRR